MVDVVATQVLPHDPADVPGGTPIGTPGETPAGAVLPALAEQTAEQLGDQATLAQVRAQRALLELGRMVLGQAPLGQVLERVAELAVAHVPGADEVSVTLLEGVRAHSAAFSGGLAVSLDERQYRLGFGPCLDAARSGQVVRIDDTANDGAYPDFSAIAARQGVRSIVSVGMQVPQRVLGAVNVYCSEDEVLDADAEQLLQVFAGCAAVALANHHLYASARALGEDVRVAMASRAVIEQATGVLVAGLHCTPREAFAHLSRRSQQSDRELREVATEIVQRAGRC